MIQLKKKFKSKWFMATAEILCADVNTNTCGVRLYTGTGYAWDEEWNYEHTKIGFSRGDYFYLKAENEVGVSDASGEHGGLPHVREWNANGEDKDSQVASEQRPFRNRIDSEKENSYCNCIIKLVSKITNRCAACDKPVDPSYEFT